MTRSARHFANKLYKIKSAKIAIASAKIKDKIITINIFGLAEGLRAMDFTAAYPTKAITADGPAVLKNIRIVNASVDIDLCLREDCQVIRTHKSDAVFYRDTLIRKNNITAFEPGHKNLMII